jgi:hypothetical protein
MSKLRTFVLPLLLALALLPNVSLAQSNVPIESLEVAIWPDYDRPQALVIYQVRLAEDTAAQGVVTLPIPASVGEPYAVAAWHPDGSLDDRVSWSATPQGAWTEIAITTETNGVWLEFYDDLRLEGDRRSYEFSWPGGVEVDALSLEVLHPVGAEDLQISPAGQVSQDASGLTYTRMDLGPLGYEQAFSAAVSYIKPSAFSGELPALRANPSLTNFEVALWPEYDQLSTLVILQGVLSPEVPLPATLSFPIPATVGEPNAVATVGSDNRLRDATYNRQVEGEWAWITFESETEEFQLEYYDDLVIDGASRSFTFFWPGMLTTDAFAFELQHPVDATALRVTPGGILQPDTTSGLIFTRSDLGLQQLGTVLAISFQYEKISPDLTINAIPTPSSIDRPATTQGGTPDLTTLLPVVLGAIGFLLLGLGILLYMRGQGRAKTSKRRPRQRKPKASPERKGVDLDAAAVFCHICGAKARASDHFCRSCGNQLRQ